METVSPAEVEVSPEASKRQNSGCGSCLTVVGGIVAVMFMFIAINTPMSPTQRAWATGTAMASERATDAVLPTITPSLPDGYRTQLSPLVGYLEVTVKGLGITKADDLTSNKLSDPTWCETTVNRTFRIEQFYQSITDLVPPLEAQSIHKKIVAALYSCIAGSVDLRFYIKLRDPSDLNLLEQSLSECTTALRQIKPWVEGKKLELSSTKTILIPTATRQPIQTIANNTANLREGPGTTYAIVGGTTVGQSLAIIARNSSGDWYQLNDGTWIAAFLVTNAPANLSIATDSLNR